MASSRLQKRMVLNRKLHVLRTLTRSKSVKKCSIIMDTILYIHALNLRIEAIEREHLNLMKLKQEVKVEKVGEGYLVRVMCNKGKDLLESILKCFDEMGLNVLQTRVFCKHYFAMEAIVEAQDQTLDVRVITQALVKVIPKQNGQETVLTT